MHNNENSWHAKLANERVAFLVKELQNGGQFLPFEELKRMATKEVPGGVGMSATLVKKVAYAIKQGNPPSTANDAWRVSLPISGAMAKWNKERQAKAEETNVCKRGHPRTPENTNKNGACKKCNSIMTKKLAKKHATSLKTKRKYRKQRALFAITAAQESSLDNITTQLSELPEGLSLALEDVKNEMEKHKYRKVEMTLQNDGAHLALETVPQVVYTKLVGTKL